MNEKEFSYEWEKWNSKDVAITTKDGNIIYGDSYYVDWFMKQKVVYIHYKKKLISVLKLSSIIKVE